MTELNASVHDGSPSVFMELLNGMWVSRAIQVAASMRLADVLGDGPQSIAYLAERTGMHAPSLYRLLRALASVGLFQEVEERVFTNTDLSLYIRADEPLSLYHLAVMQGSDWYWRMCGGLAYSVQTGKPAFDLFHGMGLSAYFAQHPEAHRLFQKVALSSRVMLNEIGRASCRERV